MKILVTGGAGFIGSNLIQLLTRQNDISVVNLDKLTYAGNLESLKNLKGAGNYHFEQVDLCNAKAVEQCFERHRPDAVMHLAAETHVDRSIDGPGTFIQTNIVGTYNLLQVSLRHWRDLPVGNRFRFLHVSTDEVYGSLEYEVPGFTETTRYDPHSPYAATKAASDHLVRSWSDTYGLPILVTNCSNNYGPYQFPEKLIPVVILNCLRDAPIPVYGKGENIRDWLYVEDHAEALWTVLNKGKKGESYNISGNSELQNIELVRVVCQIMDELAPGRQAYENLINFVTDRPGHDQRYAIDASKIRRELGWQPKENFKSGLRKTILWYLQNKSWWHRILSGDFNLQRMGKL